MTYDDIKGLGARELDAEIHCAIYGKPSPLFCRTNAPEIDASKWSDTIAVYITSDTPFSTDLNAVHEAENALTAEQLEVHFGKLLEIFFEGPSDTGRVVDNWAVMFRTTYATARQRAEALLLTLR